MCPRLVNLSDLVIIKYIHHLHSTIIRNPSSTISSSLALANLCPGILILSLQLHLLLQLPRILDSKAMLEDLPDILERHALHLRIAKVHRNPAKEADRRIEAEGS